MAGAHATRTGNEPVVVLIDPYPAYAAMFIARFYRDYGIRTVAVYRNWRTRLIMEPRQQILSSRAIAARYMLPADGDITDLVPALRAAHNVVAVAPHDEGAVRPLMALAVALDLDWAQPELLDALASKRALKQRVAQRDPQLRINAFARVSSSAEVETWRTEAGVDRFVLKPDNGSGNRDVAFFDAQSPVADLDRYFDEVGGVVLAEEYIGGDEFWVNGQVTADGEPIVTMIGRYDRQAANGKENVEFGARTLPSTSPVFGHLHDYACRVMRALGLRRSPFHLEAKVDHVGPCLIEVGLRLCGDLGVVSDAWQHGSGADFVGSAVHGYVSTEVTPGLKLDWQRADNHPVAQINGVAHRDFFVDAVGGVREVSSLPGFLFWVKQPASGDHVQPTLDLVVKPWGITVWGHDLDELNATERVLRDTIVLDGPDADQHTRTGAWRAQAPVLRQRARRAWEARPRPHQLRDAVTVARR